MPSAALYARFSTDHQRQTSVEDQLRLGRERAARDSWPVVSEFSDSATSGTVAVEARAGSQALMTAARRGEFDVLIVEALDRFSRDTVDQERMIRRLEHTGLRVIGIADGYDSAVKGRELMRQIRGAVNEEQVRVTGAKVHRGLAGQISRGFHAGGVSFGYRSVVAGVDAHGVPIGHRLEVEPETARWVKWIFEEFAAGASITTIVHGLNRQGISGPRGGTWARSALYGSPKKGSGVLNNEVYVGRYIWNRSTWRKDPDTGKWARLDRPRDEWVIEDRPELRIVPQAIWEQVRLRMDNPRGQGGMRGKGAQPRTLFGGLLTCGLCGGPMVAVSSTRYGCVARKERGPDVCAGVLAPRDPTDTRLVSLVKDELLSPAAIAEFHQELARLMAAQARQAAGDPAAAKARLAELAKEIGNLTDAIATIGLSPALQERLRKAEQDRERLTAQANARKPAAGAIPAALAHYRALILRLQTALQKDAAKARPDLQALLGTIRMVPGTAKGEIYAEIEGQTQLAIAAGSASLGVVAGTRLLSRRIRIR
jgi:site-specific DNA recombinase